jgi:hypothetical protein
MHIERLKLQELVLQGILLLTYYELSKRVANGYLPFRNVRPDTTNLRCHFETS